ncbi:reverse transcriptase [Senna tora]|uniref:Reverse transcriptase n=1 Tax=Senna tora TaxID=362788 RepID=A0A834SSM1_9FABA|nr:reverse transcriptase [Senna tora]
MMSNPYTKVEIEAVVFQIEGSKASDGFPPNFFSRAMANDRVEYHRDIQATSRSKDPISPYLFILCLNILSLKFIREQEAKTIKGIKLDLESCNRVYTIWQEFSYFSRLGIIYEKTKVKFSPNTPRRF